MGMTKNAKRVLGATLVAAVAVAVWVVLPTGRPELPAPAMPRNIVQIPAPAGGGPAGVVSPDEHYAMGDKYYFGNDVDEL